MAMDKVFNSDDLHFVSPVTPLRNFLRQGVDVMSRMQSKLESPQADDFASRFAAYDGSNYSVVRGLEETCSVEACKTMDGLEADDQDPFISVIPSGPLKCLELQKAEVEKRSRDAQYKCVALRNLKYDHFDFTAMNKYRELARQIKVEEWGPRYIPDDVILTCILMKPYNRTLDNHEIRLGRLLKVDSVFLLCGNVNLTKLRDKIQCSADFAVDQDFSLAPDSIEHNHFSKEKYPSNFFFIHDTFYIDTRNPESVDLSREIRAWARRRPDEMGPFNVADMSGVRVIDLTLRLGQPYLYLHQGSCEHLIDETVYPISLRHKNPKRFACCACKIHTARWTVHGNDRIPFEPAFFCDHCFKKFNYNSDGQKMGDFTAVPFFDRSAL